jgi:hypothetical protein
MGVRAAFRRGMGVVAAGHGPWTGAVALLASLLFIMMTQLSQLSFDFDRAVTIRVAVSLVNHGRLRGCSVLTQIEYLTHVRSIKRR